MENIWHRFFKEQMCYHFLISLLMGMDMKLTKIFQPNKSTGYYSDNKCGIKSMIAQASADWQKDYSNFCRQIW